MDNNLTYEEEIVWLKPEAKALPYVREGVSIGSRRKKLNPLKYRKTIVAYAALKESTPSEFGRPGRFRRRIWYLAKHDPYPNGDCPREAVLPFSITAGKESTIAFGAIS